MSQHMMKPQAWTLRIGAHLAGAREAPVTSCQTHSWAVLLHLGLSTEVVVLVEVGHLRARSRRRGHLSSTSRLVEQDRVLSKHVSRKEELQEDIGASTNEA